jgi:hypothetical protein
VNAEGLFIDGKKLPLLSGEFHYWRVNKANWNKCLDRIIEAGFNIVATYVPWNYHELKPGKYDFEGKTDPQRDLEGFLKLCEQKGLYVIIRPGPYIYSEWLHYGPPEYAVKHHRLSKDFMKAAEPYIKAVSKVIAPRQVTRGGRIIMLQADNEIDPWTMFYRDQLGLNGGMGPFQQYLRSIYRSIGKLNNAWKTHYRSFEDVKAFEVVFNKFGSRRRNLDYKLFLEWYVCEVAKRIISMYKASGIEVPIYLNTYAIYNPQNFYELQKIADLVGIDIYPRSMLEDGFNHYAEIMKYAEATLKFPYIAEFECGIWYGWHYQVGTLGPQHYKFKDLLALAHGVKGWNYYMLGDRDNWMMSPINEWGRVHLDVYAWMKEITRIFHELDPSSMQRLCEVSVLAYRPHKLIEAGNWNLIQDSLHRADIDYELYDPWTEKDCETKLLIYAGADFMLKRDQERLRDFVEKGGTLLFFVCPPLEDVDGTEVNTFLDVASLPTSSKDAGWAEHYEVSLKDVKKSIYLARFWTYDVPEAEAIMIRKGLHKPFLEENLFIENLQAGAVYTVGYHRKVGKGSILTLGFEPSPEALELATEALGIPYYAKASTPDVLTSIYRGKEKHVIFVVNNSKATREATVKVQVEKLGIKPDGKYRVTDLVERKEEKLNGKMLSRIIVKLQPYDVKILRISK